MNDDQLRVLANQAVRRRRFPANARCAVCGRAEHLASRTEGRILCYQDARVAAGLPPIEADHIAGRAVIGGLTMDLFANGHRTVTELRVALGMDTWPQANGDPLLTLAYLAAGIATLLWLAALYLIELAAAATGRLGPTAWAEAPRSPFA